MPCKPLSDELAAEVTGVTGDADAEETDPTLSTEAVTGCDCDCEYASDMPWKLPTNGTLETPLLDSLEYRPALDTDAARELTTLEETSTELLTAGAAASLLVTTDEDSDRPPDLGWTTKADDVTTAIEEDSALLLDGCSLEEIKAVPLIAAEVTLDTDSTLLEVDVHVEALKDCDPVYSDSVLLEFAAVSDTILVATEEELIPLDIGVVETYGVGVPYM